MPALSSSSSSPSRKTWFITGCSSGIGRELVLAALAHGDNVVATARKVSTMEDLKQLGALTLTLDVTSFGEVLQKTVVQAVEVYGTIDILVNNAGYFLEGAVEECSAEEAFHQYNTNVFGVLNVCRAVLPYMRAQRSGLVAIIGSVAAWRGYAATGLYCSSKAAAASISESLRGDVAHLGIEVTVVEPGYFRTSVLTTNHAYAKQRIADLEPATLPAKKEYARNAGKEAGDPVKGAKLLVELFTKTGRGEGRTLPARLVLGKGAVGIEHAILALREQELRDWEEIVSATDFDDL